MRKEDIKMLSTNISLPVEKTARKLGELPERFLMLVVGKTKVGKTTFASTFPEPLIISMDNGTVALENPAYVAEVSDLSEFDAVVKLLYQQWKAYERGEIDEFIYKTIVVDPITVLNEWVENKVCKERGIKAVGDADWGAGWADARREMLVRLQTLKKIKVCNLILIGHIDERSSATMEVLDLKRIELPGKLKNLITGIVDLVAYLRVSDDEVEYRGRKTQKRILSFSAISAWEAGSRFPELEGIEIEPTYQNLITKFEEYRREEKEND